MAEIHMAKTSSEAICGERLRKAPVKRTERRSPIEEDFPVRLTHFDIGYSVKPEDVTCERCLKMISESRNARSATVQRNVRKGK